MKPLTQIAHELISTHLMARPEGFPLRAVDATAGNGHDTRFLADLVGPQGHVWAIDIQPDAIRRTRAQLGELESRVSFIVGDHAQLSSFLPAEMIGRIAIIMFNLGYLPGGEKSTITHSSSTVAALHAGFEILTPGGLISVLAYPGHPGGAEEASAVADWLSRFEGQLTVIHTPDSGSPPHRPQLWLAQKQGIHSAFPLRPA